MKAAIRGSREHISAEIDDVDSPTAEEAFEKTTLSINQQKIIKGESLEWSKQRNIDQLIMYATHFLINNSAYRCVAT